MGIIAFVPVRGGSKSIPLKNIKPLCNKPLIYWILNEMQSTTIIDRIIVSTDSIQIKKIVESFKMSKVELFERAAHTATDKATTESAILDFFERTDSTLIDDNIFMLVQATSPLTQRIHFEEGINLFLTGKFDSLLTCVESKRFFWEKTGFPINYDYRKRPRRQDFNGLLMENGAFYISTIKSIKNSLNRISNNIGIYIMPEYTSFEIDEEMDWIVMENLMKKYHLGLKRKNRKIKLFISDVDGVLTDSGMYYSENGDELKKFNTKDGMAFQMLREAGIKTGIITSEETTIVEKRAKKIKADFLFQAKKHNGKLAATLQICKTEKIKISEVAYIGDDINCKELLMNVGFPACPVDASLEIQNIPNILIMQKKGGEGVVREFAEIIINNNNN